MSQENSTPSTGSKNNKYFILLALLMMGIGVAMFYATENQVSSIWRILGLLAVGVLSLAVIYLSELGKRGVAFIGGARNEIRKVIWPTRQETIQMSLIVFVAVVLIGLFLWLIDTLFLWLVDYLTSL